MAQRHQDLKMYEQALLLGLRDEEGTTERKAGMFSLALGGTLLAELLLTEKARVVERQGKAKERLELIGKAPADEILSECFALVEETKKPRKPSLWVSKFGNQSKLKHRIAEGLCRKGILQETEDKVLMVFSRRTFPTVDPGPEEDLVARWRDAVLVDDVEAPAVLSERETVLLSIAKATGLLRVHFDGKELKRHKDRLEFLIEGGSLPEAGRATLDAVKATQAAIMAATTSAAIAASAAG